jgi:Iodothyronine deiodinase
VARRFSQQAQFLLVYIREAHPTDGWTMPNSQLTDPRSQFERDLVAGQCCRALKFDFPALVDTMDDQTAVTWAAWPERIFVISPEGRVLYAGQQGPWGFWPSNRSARQARKIEGAAKMLGKHLKGESLEAFLAKLFHQEPPPERVEPRIAEAKTASEPHRGNSTTAKHSAPPANAERIEPRVGP